MEDGFRKVFPNLEKYIVFTEVGTPLTTNHFLGKKFGECYGRAAVPKHWGCQDLHPYTPCPNYYLTGQDVGACTTRPRSYSKIIGVVPFSSQ